MKALCWHGKADVRIDEVPDPRIIEPGDVLLRVTKTAICGSDLHLYDGMIPAMEAGDVLGHEFMGEVVETGPGVEKLSRGDRIVVPFNISCGACPWCRTERYSLCDNSNPDAEKNVQLYGQKVAGMFGYSHLFGGYAGGQAEYVRVPYADVGPMKVPQSLSDEEVLFLTDIFPTGYQAAAQVETGPEDVVAVWGLGPVGLFALRSAQLLGAKQVIGIDRVHERRALAHGLGADVIDEDTETVYDRLMELTGGMGPSVAIDAVGMEAHGSDPAGKIYDAVKTALFMETDRANAIRQIILCVRKGGRVSIPGVYAGVIDKFPLGGAFGKGLRFEMGQTDTRRWMPQLLAHIENGDIDPTFLVTHRTGLADGPEMYRTFRAKHDGCIKVVMTP